MHAIFTNSRKSKISDRHRLLLNLSDKINLKRSDRYVASSNLSICYKWKKIKKSHKNNKLEMSASAWNKKRIMKKVYHQKTQKIDWKSSNKNIWDKVFKSSSSKVYERQPLKNLKGYGLRKQYTLEYFVTYIHQ